jgi:acetyl-CoA acetyltransferase
MSWDAVAAKFHRLAAAHIDSGIRAPIVDAVRRLDEQDHLGLDELMRLLTTPLTSDERSDL